MYNNSVQRTHAAWLMLIMGAATVCMLMGCVTVKRHIRRNEALLQACQQGDEAAVRRLLGQGANPNTRLTQSFRERLDYWLDDYPDKSEPLDTTALVEAAAQGHTAIVRLLIDQGANVNTRCRYEGPQTECYDPTLYTARRLALSGHHLDTARVLEQAGAKE